MSGWHLHVSGPRMRGAVRRMVGWREDGPPVARLEPATTVTPLILMLGPRIRIDGDPLGSFAAGPYLRPVTTSHDGVQEGIQIDVEPLVARRLLGVPLDELAGRCVVLEDLLGPFVTELVADAPDWEGRFTRLERVLARRLAEAPPLRSELAPAVARLQRGSPVATVARDLGWSRRHLGRLVRDGTGMSPQSLSRISRFERTLARVRAGVPLAEAAQDGGYADQPHLNREFRAFTGLAPRQYLRRVEDPDILGVAAGEQVPSVQDRTRSAA